MPKIKKIQGLWAVVDAKNRDIMECFDSESEAKEYFKPFKTEQALKEFDRERNWISLWDAERGTE